MIPGHQWSLIKWSLLGRLLIAEERVDGSIFLMFLSVMERDMLVLKSGRFALNETSLWSEKGMSNAVQFLGVMPEQQMRSMMWPFECVGESICCCNPKLSRQEENSFVRLLFILSMCILKSPSSITFGDRDNRVAVKSEKSFKKSGFGFGGL